MPTFLTGGQITTSHNVIVTNKIHFRDSPWAVGSLQPSWAPESRGTALRVHYPLGDL